MENCEHDWAALRCGPGSAICRKCGVKKGPTKKPEARLLGRAEDFFGFVAD